MSREYKIVVLGAGGVGKSALTVQFTQGIFLNSYDPTIEDSYRKPITLDGQTCVLEILDTAGVEQFTAMRELYINNGQGFLLVYNMTDRSSLQELERVHDQILRIKDVANAPIVIVGNKADLSHARTVPFQEAKSAASRWGSSALYETSARTGQNVNDVFLDLVQQIQSRELEHDAVLKLENEQQQQVTRVRASSRTSERTEKHSHSFSISTLKHAKTASDGGRRISRRSSGKQPDAVTGVQTKKTKKSRGGVGCIIL
ncbi:P-loop containing nucleoside triphosphate hydrolase protein [Lipomyces japonicus]|uniref:P-loop containing nucleoside triphosphate hydrolase protein n=1 Tax=Lipomyces japonicus TaxID=56871 RepID=UPI0034CEE690